MITTLMNQINKLVFTITGFRFTIYYIIIIDVTNVNKKM